MLTTTTRRLIGVALSASLNVQLVRADDTPCYFPNRDRAYDFLPCGDAAATACCGPAQICLDNKYCMSIGQPFTLARGACTDQGWTSSACPSQCQDESSTFASTTVTEATSSATDTTASTTNVSSGATDTSFPGISDISACQTENHNVPIGVGVGVPLAATAVAAVAWALWEKRKRMALMQKSAPAPAELSDQHPHHKPWGADITLQSPHSRYQSGTPSELGSGI
ncbi:hypothetical protein BJ166DRAFT_617125 [Pestalotiopsis sp. NC0098]|nr:hypothetical protein BJ166DRAFT_617125 [Pestalotiopsis sp. NC0098]